MNRLYAFIRLKNTFNTVWLGSVLFLGFFMEYSGIFSYKAFSISHFFSGSQEMNDPLRKGTRDEKLSEQELE